jgi:probable rRNA maturation factor
MSRDLCLRNRQRLRPVDLKLLRKVIGRLLADLQAAPMFDLTVHLTNAAEMTRLNETKLQHGGSTDVITFDYSIAGPQPMLAGEIFVCVDEALSQARRFRTTWQSELVRYIVHGVLHLQGHDDLKPAARVKMKREENRLVRELAREFDLSKLQRKTRVSA